MLNRREEEEFTRLLDELSNLVETFYKKPTFDDLRHIRDKFKKLKESHRGKRYYYDAFDETTERIIQEVENEFLKRKKLYDDFSGPVKFVKVSTIDIIEKMDKEAGTMCFCKEDGCFYIYNGGTWVKLQQTDD